MKRNNIFTLILIVVSILFSSVTQVLSQDTRQSDIPRERRAQTNLKFLSVSMDARAAGMGNAMTAQQLSSSAMFYNPASMAFIENNVDVYLGQTNWIADVVYNAGSIAWNSPIGVIGLHGVFVNYGDILETVRADNDKGFVDIGTFNPSESVIGIGYAQSLTDRFSVGGNIKYAQQDLGEATIEMNESGDPVKEA